MRRLAVPVLKMLAASALMAAAIVAVKRFANLPPVPELAVSVVVGGAVYFSAMAAMGMGFRLRRG